MDRNFGDKDGGIELTRRADGTITFTKLDLPRSGLPLDDGTHRYEVILQPLGAEALLAVTRDQEQPRDLDSTRVEPTKTWHLALIERAGRP